MALSALAPLGTVLTDLGRVDIKRLSAELDLPVPALAPALGRSSRWINEHPTAASFQPAALELVDAINALARSLGGMKFARAWLKTPNPQFAQRTPADVLRFETNGRSAVVGLIRGIVTHQPD
ncbi:MAG: hypothetical protein JWM87_4364 [Candidatus Eremiobacteraeota bacterium]|nr:hypothetical protein [Candidatus Eremiobacteraeota bacterium]